MDKRLQELTELNDYVANIDKESTLLLQNLQWDQKHLIESKQMVSCKYVTSHRIPLDTREAHEKQCYLTQQGYSKEDVLLPDLMDPEAHTVVKLSKQDIMQITQAAAASDPLFKKGVPCEGPEPLSAARLQHTYTADQRRAVHDAVVAAAPSCQDLADLALASSSEGPQTSKEKSRVEILAELRDMKRRRTKYRVTAKTQKYSDVMRDVIKTQMELCTDTTDKTEFGSKNNNKPTGVTETNDKPTKIVIKHERISPEVDKYSAGSSKFRERSKGGDVNGKRKHDREPESKSKRDRHSKQGSSDKKRSKDSRQDRHRHTAKERIRRDDRATRSKNGSDKTKEGVDILNKLDQHTKTEEVDTFRDNSKLHSDTRVYNNHRDSHKHDGGRRNYERPDSTRSGYHHGRTDNSILNDSQQSRDDRRNYVKPDSTRNGNGDGSTDNNISKDSQQNGDERRNYVKPDSTRNIVSFTRTPEFSSVNDTKPNTETNIKCHENDKVREQYQRMHDSADIYRAIRQRIRYGYKLKGTKQDVLMLKRDRTIDKLPVTTTTTTT